MQWTPPAIMTSRRRVCALTAARVSAISSPAAAKEPSRAAATPVFGSRRLNKRWEEPRNCVFGACPGPRRRPKFGFEGGFSDFFSSSAEKRWTMQASIGMRLDTQMKLPPLFPLAVVKKLAESDVVQEEPGKSPPRFKRQVANHGLTPLRTTPPRSPRQPSTAAPRANLTDFESTMMSRLRHPLGASGERFPDTALKAALTRGGLASVENDMPDGVWSRMREKLAHLNKTLPDKPLDVVLIGEGLSSRFTAAFIVENHNQLPEEQRTNPHDGDGHLRMLTIGPNATTGAGRAYTDDRGYADDELVNLLRRQMEFTRAVPNPIDAEMLKRSRDVNDRRLANQRPFDYGEDYVDETVPDDPLTFSLAADRRNSFSLEDYDRRVNPDSQSETVTRKTFGHYLVHCVEHALGKSDRVHMDGIDGDVVNVKYDKAEALFTITATRQADDRKFTVQARNVVLAIGHHPEKVPAFLKDVADLPNVHIGERIPRFLKSVSGNAHALRGQRGLIVDTGLTLNDVAVKLHQNEVDQFVALSRSGHTHELPLAVPGEEMDKIPGFREILDTLRELTELPALLHEARRESDAHGGAYSHHIVEKMKEALENSRGLIDEYMDAYADAGGADKSPMVIRGATFERERVIRALFSQYAAYRYEKMRNQPLTDQLGPHIAKAVVTEALGEIDFSARHASWLTTSRTSTTDRNILANRRLREEGRLRRDDITERVKALPDGRLLVQFPSGKTEVFDYLVCAAGRHPSPGNAEQLPDIPVINGLVEDGWMHPEPAGLGVAIDHTGRAVPKEGLLEGAAPPNLFPVAPSLSKFKLLFPQKRGLDAHNDSVGESAMALRRLCLQAGDEITLNIYGPNAEIPAPEDQLEYVYYADGVEPQFRDG